MKSSTCFLAKATTGEKGFTLIETMISLFVFTIGIMAVMSMTITSNNSLIRSRTSTVEVNRTCLNVEALMNLGYGSTTTVVGTDGETISVSDSYDTVIKGTRLIQIQNNAIRGGDASGNYTLYFTIPEVI